MSTVQTRHEILLEELKQAIHDRNLDRIRDIHSAYPYLFSTVDERGRHQFHWLIDFKEHLPTIKLILSLNTENIHQSDRRGLLPINYALKRDRISTVKLYLEAMSPSQIEYTFRPSRNPGLLNVCFQRIIHKYDHDLLRLAILSIDRAKISRSLFLSQNWDIPDHETEYLKLMLKSGFSLSQFRNQTRLRHTVMDPYFHTYPKKYRETIKLFVALDFNFVFVAELKMTLEDVHHLRQEFYFNGSLTATLLDNIYF